MSFANRLQHAWNAFLNRDPTETEIQFRNLGPGYTHRQDRIRFSFGNEKSIVNPIYNRIALDVAALDIKHVRLDENDRYLETIKSNLNDTLSLSANMDQTGRCLIQDIVMSMCDEGCVAVVPVDTTIDPNMYGYYDIQSLRVGQIIQWYPAHVKVRLYNEKKGIKEDITVAKRSTAIIENPFYSTMNELNSVLRRLITKLNLLDAVDNQSGAGKLDLIIQLPYVIKNETKKNQAELRRQDIETQLSGSKYGIAYTDGTEKITQLNRPVDNNLITQVTYLTSMLYSQLGLTQSVFDGTADEKTMLNYYNRSIDPIASAIIDEMNRKFLTKTARTQRQVIRGYRNPFKLVPVNQLAEIVDVFTRNEILTSNEIRSVVGYKPIKDGKSDELRNSNMPQTPTKIPKKEDVIKNE